MLTFYETLEYYTRICMVTFIITYYCWNVSRVFDMVNNEFSTFTVLLMDLTVSCGLILCICGLYTLLSMMMLSDYSKYKYPTKCYNSSVMNQYVKKCEVINENWDPDISDTKFDLVQKYKMQIEQDFNRNDFHKKYILTDRQCPYEEQVQIIMKVLEESEL